MESQSDVKRLLSIPFFGLRGMSTYGFVAMVVLLLLSNSRWTYLLMKMLHVEGGFYRFSSVFRCLSPVWHSTVIEVARFPVFPGSLLPISSKGLSDSSTSLELGIGLIV